MVEAKVTGLPDFKAALLSLPDKLRKRPLLNSLRSGARVVRDAARVKAPVLDVPTRRRKPGTLRNALSVRTSKRDRLAGDVGVFVNVRPAKGAKFRTVRGTALLGLVKTKTRTLTKASQRGKDSPDDPYYWPWVAFGHKIIARFAGKYEDYRIRGRGRLTGLAKRRRAPTGFVPGVNFMEAGAHRLGEALRVFAAKLRPEIDKLNKGQTP